MRTSFPYKMTPLTKICLPKFPCFAGNTIYGRGNLKTGETFKANYSTIPPTEGQTLPTPLYVKLLSTVFGRVEFRKAPEPYTFSGRTLSTSTVDVPLETPLVIGPKSSSLKIFTIGSPLWNQADSCHPFFVIIVNKYFEMALCTFLSHLVFDLNILLYSTVLSMSSPLDHSSFWSLSNWLLQFANVPLKVQCPKAKIPSMLLSSLCFVVTCNKTN